jgi:hypothetical protein
VNKRLECSPLDTLGVLYGRLAVQPEDDRFSRATSGQVYFGKEHMLASIGKGVVHAWMIKAAIVQQEDDVSCKATL